MKEKAILIGILSYLSTKLFYNFCSVVLGTLFAYPADNFSRILLIGTFVLLSLFVFTQLCRLKFSTGNIVLLCLLPIAIGLGNYGLIQSFARNISLSNYAEYYEARIVADKILVLLIIAFLSIKVLLKPKDKVAPEDIIDQPVE